MACSNHLYGFRFLTALVAFFVGPKCTLSEEIQLVSPSQFADMESQNDLPTIPGSEGSFRGQILYEASDFSSLAGPHLITQFAWRPNGSQSESFIVSSESVLFRLSTSEKTVGNMSSTFDENVGPDEQVVAQNDEPMSIEYPVVGPPGGPMEFTIVSELGNPFLYDPSQGNLLLDFIISSASELPADNVAVPDPTLTTKWIAGPAEGTTSLLEFGGIITEFTFAPVPEPCSGVLLCIGLAAGISAIRHGKAKRF